jgi:hypothetical protein
VKDPSASAASRGSVPDWVPQSYKLVSVVEVDCAACDARRVRYAQLVPRAVPTPSDVSRKMVVYNGALYRVGDGILVDGYMGSNTRVLMRKSIEGAR